MTDDAVFKSVHIETARTSCNSRIINIKKFKYVKKPRFLCVWHYNGHCFALMNIINFSHHAKEPWTYLQLQNHYLKFDVPYISRLKYNINKRQACLQRCFSSEKMQWPLTTLTPSGYFTAMGKTPDGIKFYRERAPFIKRVRTSGGHIEIESFKFKGL